MANNKSDIMLQDEVIADKIYLIRGKKVMLDRDLAELYNIEIKQLKRAVRRNINRFPEDVMFELSKEELEKWRKWNTALASMANKSKRSSNILSSLNRSRNRNWISNTEKKVGFRRKNEQ